MATAPSRSRLRAGASEPCAQASGLRDGTRGYHPWHDLSQAARGLALLAIVLIWTATAFGQLPLPVSTQFDVTGFIQEAILDPACPAIKTCGGTIKVNGHVITVPKQTIVILPANALTWQEIFAQAPTPFGIPGNPGVLSTVPATGLAMADCGGTFFPPATCPAPPLTTYEAQVVGNRVTTALGGDQYIAGLINISQHALNSGAGFINYIDYTLGEIRVGGLIGSNTTGTRVRVNDPLGRYGRVMTPDRRFTVDPDNPTIRSETGFPMCLPRTDPLSPAPDALCPQSNRPKDQLGTFLPTVQMSDPRVTPIPYPNPTMQAPFEVGDYITFAGTLVHDGLSPTAGPWPGTAATYVSAHTITNNIAVYTWPGTNPAYVAVDVTIIGTGGLTVLGAGEAAVRTRFEGFTTDPSRNIHLYGIDLDPATGATSDRDWGMIGVDQGPPTGAVKGRWRFRPPCTQPLNSPTEKVCSPPSGGTFLPPTREVRAVIQGAWIPGQTATTANGIVWGQYHAPILEYIFPENIPGAPIVPNNFEAIPFLAFGGYTSAGDPSNSIPGTLVGQLNVWPGAAAPTGGCIAPVGSAGGPYTVGSGGSIGLLGTATGTTPMAFSWAAPALGSLSNPNIANPTYIAPIVSVATTVNLSLTMTNACGSWNSPATVNITTAGALTVFAGLARTVQSGTPVTLQGTATGGTTPYTISWIQTAGPTVTLTPSGNPPNPLQPTFTLSLPVGTTAPVTLAFTLTVTDSASPAHVASSSTTVTVNPAPDLITITLAEYRTSKLRLTINATSSVVSPGVILTLQPYVTASGTTYNPDPLAGGVGNVFTNNGGGLYIIDLVGAPQPAIPPATPLVVKSNLGGASAPSPLTRIRQ